jgi:cytochrome c553
MVARGEQVYDTYCMSCHGPELRGDGPLNESLNPPAADFAAPHTFVHSDNDLIYWIKNGKQGTAMPGFAAQLTDQEMRDVIAFIQNWQANFDPSAESTGQETILACEVAPLTFAEIPEIFHHGIMPDIARGTPLIQAADSTVDGDTANDVMWTVEQMVACTNSDESLSRLRLYSASLLQEVFPSGADQRLTSLTTRTPQPLGPDQQVSIDDVQSVFRLADGRIAVSVIFEDPAGVGVVPGANPINQVTLIMIEQDGAWIVDEVR